MISHWYSGCSIAAKEELVVRALFSGLPLPARDFTLKVVLAKAQFTACSSHDVMKTNCSLRVNYDKLKAL